MSWVTYLLSALLVVVQADLWFGKGNLPYVASLRKELLQQQQLNVQAHERNERVAAEVADLKVGDEIVEEKARAELGMVRGDEILVRVAPAR